MSNTPTRGQQAVAQALAAGVIQAWSEGKAIQSRKCEERPVLCRGEVDRYVLGHPVQEWCDITHSPNWEAYPYEWRVAPTPPPEPTVIHWIKGSPPPIEGVQYLQACCGYVETIQWCPYAEKFVDGSGGWNTVEFWAPMCNLPGSREERAAKHAMQQAITDHAYQQAYDKTMQELKEKSPNE